MNETAPTDPTPDARTPRADKVDLEHVNPLQQAVIDRARAAGERGKWLPEISAAQWVVSILIALVVVYGIFSVVDAGLTAFQKFAEVAMQPAAPPADAPPAPAVDITQPVPIILVPESGNPAEAPPPPPPN